MSSSRRAVATPATVATSGAGTLPGSANPVRATEDAAYMRVMNLIYAPDERLQRGILRSDKACSGRPPE
jgi:hypothetical protein